MLVPFLLGGNRNFGLPTYQGSYNLPEITVGVGLLPLVAAAWFLPELGRRAIEVLRSLDRRMSRGAQAMTIKAAVEQGHSLGVWYVMAIVGFILTLGGTTPIGRILVRIPLYGGERLQNRNAVIFDLALAALFALFVDDVRDSRTSTRDRVTGWLSASRVRSALVFVPIVGCLVVLAQTRGNAIAFERRLGVPHPFTELFSRLAPYLAWTLGLALCVAVFLVVASRWSRRSCTVALAVLALGDIGTYVGNASFAGVPSPVLDATNAENQQLAAMAGNHRVGLYNPLVLRPTSATPAQAVLAEPDVNVVQQVPSIQGYGSIVSGAYQTATATHDFEGLDLTVMRNGLENSLNLGLLLTLPTYLGIAIPKDGPIPLAGGGALNADGTASTAVVQRAPLSSGPWTITPRTAGSWWLPATSELRDLTIVVTPVTGHARVQLQIGLSRPGPIATHYDVTTTGKVARASLQAGVFADEISIKNLGAAPVVVSALAVTAKDSPSSLLLDGALQGWLPASQWAKSSPIGPFIAFVNQHALGTAWLQPTNSLAPTGAAPSLGSVSGIVAPKSGGEVMQIVAKRPALLIRSAAWAPGWKASITSSKGGAAHVVAVGQLGLVEAISVPAGSSSVRWFYAPAGVIGSGILTLASGGVIIVLFLVTLLRIRRRAKEDSQLWRTADVEPDA
jgi:hypothetical protein